MIAERHMQQHGSRYIAELEKRLPKCWQVVDWALSSAASKRTQKEVALFLLSKALPNKIDGNGFIPKIEVHVELSQTAPGSLSAPRFPAPSLS